MDTSETGKFGKETEIVKKKNKKNLILDNFFYMMEQKIAPLNLGFMTLAIKYFQIILAFFQKKVGCK